MITTLFPSFVIRNVVGHVPLGLSKTFSNFLSLPASTMLCIVTGKRLNRGAGLGLEIRVMYQARGHEKAIQWLEKNYHQDSFAW